MGHLIPERKDKDLEKTKCYIFAWGNEPFSASTLETMPTSDDFLIAADSGCEKMRGFGLCPNVVIGDMDSFDLERAKNIYPSADFIIYPPEKDWSDTKLCLDYAIEKGFRNIIMVGGLGGRLDHTLANINLLRYAYKKGVRLEINDGRNRAFFVKDDDFSVKRTYRMKYFSVIPFSENLEGVTMTGVKYPLDNAVVTRDDAITLSNEITDRAAHVTIKSGEAVVIESSD